ncbi:LptA/OstA family protein [Azospirillum halopraeferens]|uniref:LptA/OstA family protein n=1 Tax=Azospirillum halopraeferens TaxID=34010 RepID=UPI000417CAED|nr:LptA/OstA family protein [Azospirillum halopraeferens]
MTLTNSRRPVRSAAPAVAVALAFGLWGLAAGPAAAQLVPDGADGLPVAIDADQAIEWHQDRKAYVARGRASAERGGTTVHGDVLTAYYREIPGKGNEVFQLVANGNVRIVGPGRQVLGGQAIYDADRRVLVVTGGNLRLVTSDHLVTAEDSLEYYEDRGLAVARGNAVAVRGDDRMRADVLVGLLVGGADGATRLNRIDGSGSVVITTPTDVARSEKLIYSAADEVAVLLGNVRLTRGDNQLNGEAAEMNMRTRINRVISGREGAGRVRGLLIPGSEPTGAPAGSGTAR